MRREWIDRLAHLLADRREPGSPPWPSEIHAAAHFIDSIIAEGQDVWKGAERVASFDTRDHPHCPCGCGAHMGCFFEDQFLGDEP